MGATITETTPDGIPLKPDVPTRLVTPPGVPEDETIWFPYGGGVPSEGDDDRLRYVLFSGGDDSLALVHKIMSSGEGDAVLYLNTNSGLAENLEYVKAVCREHGWPLRVERSPVSLVEMSMKYHFPGSAFHSIAYAYFKERQLGFIASEWEGKPVYITGVRKHESDRRMENVADDVWAEADNGRWVWGQPLFDWTDEDVDEYRDKHDLRRNPISAKIHRSGDCYCGAFAHRDELLIDLYSNGYDRHATWLGAVETRVQEYRGRLAYIEEEYPDVWEAVDDRREQYNPKPMRLSISRTTHPDVAEWAEAISTPDAIAKGRQDERNYWGHGEMANDELRSLVAKNDGSQMELCQFCG